MASQFPILYSPSQSMRGFDPFLDLSREMNKLMDNFFPGAGNLIGVGAKTLAGTIPRIDVEEDEEEICISAELPGVSVSDVDVRVDGDVISICGEKRSLTDTSAENYRVMERTYGSFRRTVPLPFTPDPQQIRAEYGLGVLTIHVPRQAEIEVSQRIEVKDMSEEDMQRQFAQRNPEGEGSEARGDNGGNGQAGFAGMSSQTPQEPGESNEYEEGFDVGRNA